MLRVTKDGFNISEKNLNNRSALNFKLLKLFYDKISIFKKLRISDNIQIYK